MNQLPSFWYHKSYRAFVLTALLAIGLSILVSLVPLYSTLALGFTLDFLLTAPLLYLLLIRKTAVPAITVVPLSGILLLLATYSLPKEHHQYLDLYKTFALPVLELFVVVTLVFKIRKAGLVLKAAQAQQADMYERLKAAAREVIPVPAVASSVIATEAGMFYYAAATFRKSNQPQGFGYHQEAGLMAIVGALMLLIVVETIAVHLLLMQWSVLAANVLTILSVYSLVYVLAIAGAAKHRPHKILNEGLMVRFGLQESLIPYGQIAQLERLRGDVPEEKPLAKLGLLDNFNMIIRVKEPQVLSGLYGIRRSYKTIVFWVDHPEQFVEACEQAMRESE